MERATAHRPQVPAGPRGRGGLFPRRNEVRPVQDVLPVRRQLQGGRARVLGDGEPGRLVERHLGVRPPQDRPPNRFGNEHSLLRVQASAARRVLGESQSERARPGDGRPDGPHRVGPPSPRERSLAQEDRGHLPPPRPCAGQRLLEAGLRAGGEGKGRAIVLLAPAVDRSGSDSDRSRRRPRERGRGGEGRGGHGAPHPGQNGRQARERLRRGSSTAPRRLERSLAER